MEIVILILTPLIIYSAYLNHKRHKLSKWNQLDEYLKESKRIKNENNKIRTYKN